MVNLNLRRISYAVVVATGSVAAGCGAYVGYLQVSGNFHQVIPGELYRSGQPSAEDLGAYVQTYGIKTVVNLRGFHPEKAWYRDEVAMSKGLGVTHIDFGISASKDLPAEKAAQLVAFMKSAPKPILVHCQSGADRSGLVAALYVHQVAGQSEETARGQLSFYYGHVGIPLLSAAYAMDRSWQAIETRDNHQISAAANRVEALR
ncbi:tyrosine phosphatase family protein [Rhizobium sp. BK376]|nr:tyrosine phosphatase family protein [Rhizobium sp. BK376]